jgi:hypothetical protein
LTNLAPYTAYCKLIGRGELEEHVIRTPPLTAKPDPKMAEAIRRRSRQLATSRRDVEEEIQSKTGWKAPQMTYYE